MSQVWRGTGFSGSPDFAQIALDADGQVRDALQALDLFALSQDSDDVLETEVQSEPGEPEESKPLPDPAAVLTHAVAYVRLLCPVHIPYRHKVEVVSLLESLLEQVGGREFQLQ